jgi:hypothetical protein
LRIAGAVWLGGEVVHRVLSELQARLFMRMRGGEPFEAIQDDVMTLAWMSYGLAWLTAATVVLVAGAWARVPGRAGLLVRAGQVLVAVATLLHMGLALDGISSPGAHDDEMRRLVQRTVAALLDVGLVALLAGSRSPIPMRVGYGLMTIAWLTVVLGVTSNVDEQTAQLLGYVPLALAATWSAGVWLAASAYADDEARMVEPEGSRVDDPTRLRAAAGLLQVRGALVARIAVSILSIGVLVWLRNAPGSAALVVWLFALVQCAIAVAIGSGLTQYSSLRDAAIDRGNVNTVLVCVTIGALVELVGAYLTSDLLSITARAMNGDFVDIPRLSELEAMQARALWVGRLSGVVGIIAGVSLALSLRQTAVWLDDAPSIARASTLAVATILAGGGATVLLAVAQSGAVASLTAIAGLALVALVLAIAILTTWLRLIGAIAKRLAFESG